MDNLTLRRRAMKTKKPNKTYTFEFENNVGGRMFDVEEGQTLIITWNCPNGDANGWVLNGGGLTDKNISQLRYSGYTGNETVNVTGTGGVRVGSYNANANFSVKNGTIIIIVEYPN